MISTSDQDEHFICRTHFACNNDTRNNIHNHRLQCSLQSAELSNDGRTLVVVLDDMEWKRFIITGEYILLLYCMYLCGVVNSVGNLSVCVCWCVCACVCVCVCVHACNMYPGIILYWHKL